MSRLPRPTLALAPLLAIAVALGVACDGESGGDTTATPPADGATATIAAPTPSPTPEVVQLGEDPIFYSPLDNFESLRAGENYFIMFRITNGYAEETLPIVATNEAGETVEFEPLFAEPVGEGDPPGSYYPTSINLPSPGTWTITVTAGDDVATFTVEAGEPETDLSDFRY